MTEANKPVQETSKTSKIEYCGFNNDEANRVKYQKRLKDVKENIKKNIQRNIQYVNGLEEIADSIKIISHSGDYKVICVRCGTKKIWNNTTKSNVDNIAILEDLIRKLEKNEFDNEIKEYVKKSSKAKRKPKAKTASKAKA